MTTDPHAPDARVGPAPDQTAASADTGHPPPIGPHQVPFGQPGPAGAGFPPYAAQWTDPKQARAAAKAQRAHAKAMRPWYKKKSWWLVGAIIGISVAASGGGTDDDDSDRSASGADSPATTAGATDPPAAGQSGGGQDVYAVGQTAHTGDFDVTLLQVTDPYTSSNQFDNPQPGHRFVAVEMEVTNTTDDMQLVSGWLGAELTDGQNRPWDTAFAGVDLPDLDGDVAAGEARRGWMVFEVAADASELQLRIKGNLTATGSLFDLG